MSTEKREPDPGLERFRSYLHILAEARLGRGGMGVIDASDLVQQTLLDAHRDRDRFRGTGDAELRAWLRRMLACNFADEVRRRCRGQAGRYADLERAFDESSGRLESWLAAAQTSPSERAGRNEQLVALADALERLPEANRRAILLKHCQGASLADIAVTLGRTPQAVAGLLKRGLAELRELMAGDEGGER